MNYLLEVCLFAATLAMTISPWVAARVWGAAPEKTVNVLRTMTDSEPDQIEISPSWRSCRGRCRGRRHPSCRPRLRPVPQLKTLSGKWHTNRDSWFEVGSEKGREGKISAAVPLKLASGISAELPATRYAAAMPDADQEDALIVTVTEDSRLYIGENPVHPAALGEEVKTSLSNRTDKKLYIKADARTLYGNLETVLVAVGTAGVRALILLTSQRDSSQAEALVAPQDLEVLLVPLLSAGSEPSVLELLDSGERWPTLEINHEKLPWAALESRLSRLLENRAEKVVVVKADARLPLARVVDVSDLCPSLGAQVVWLVAEDKFAA